MELRVATWNAEGMFVEGSMTRRAAPRDAIMVLKRLDADVVVIPEFGVIDTLTKETDAAIRALGYDYVTMRYRDRRARGSGLAILSRYPIVRTVSLPLGEIKGAIDAEIELPDMMIRVIGVHLDDRSEQLRLREVESLVSYVGAAAERPTFMMGDFNAMSRPSLFARLARSDIGRFVERIILHSTLRSVVSRVREMALGTTIEMIEQQTDLHSLDPGLQRTVSVRQRGLECIPAVRLAKIDWIFGPPDISVESYVVSRDAGSDHRPVIAKVNIT